METDARDETREVVEITCTEPMDLRELVMRFADNRRNAEVDKSMLEEFGRQAAQMVLILNATEREIEDRMRTAHAEDEQRLTARRAELLDQRERFTVAYKKVMEWTPPEGHHHLKNNLLAQLNCQRERTSAALADITRPLRHQSQTAYRLCVIGRAASELAKIASAVETHMAQAVQAQRSIDVLDESLPLGGQSVWENGRKGVMEI